MVCFVNAPSALGLGGEPAFIGIGYSTVFYQLGKNLVINSCIHMHFTAIKFLELIQAQAELLLFNAEDKLKSNMAKNRRLTGNRPAKRANLSGFSTALSLF